MKLGEKKEFYVLCKFGTEQFYFEAGNTTSDLLKAKLCTRDEVDEFEKVVSQAGIAAEGKMPRLERVRILIAARRLQ